MTRIILMGLAVLVVSMVAVLGWRGQASDQPPLQAFDDMVDQPRYKPQADSDFFADGRSMRTAPANTVAWGRSAQRPDPSLAGDERKWFAATQLPPEMVIDRKLMQRGREMFNIYCVVCHGGAGTGNGITAQYGMVVPGYHSDTMRAFTVGHIFQVITEGKGMMGPYGDRLAVADRWAVVAYVKALQRAANGRIEDVSPDHQGELGK